MCVTQRQLKCDHSLLESTGWRRWLAGGLLTFLSDALATSTRI